MHSTVLVIRLLYEIINTWQSVFIYNFVEHVQKKGKEQ